MSSAKWLPFCLGLNALNNAQLHEWMARYPEGAENTLSLGLLASQMSDGRF